MPPEDYFFVVGRDRGLAFLQQPDWILRRVSGACVRQYACSDYPAIQEVLLRNLEPRWHQVKPAIFEINTVPVLAENVVLRGGSAEVGGKCLMNGAAGDRLYARYLMHNTGMDNYQISNKFFGRARDETVLDLPLVPDGAQGVNFAIECRNRRNFYHFVTETLSQLVHALPFETSPITLHCRNDEDVGFADRFIEDLFPELAGRVHHTDRMVRRDQVVLPLNFRHLLYANGDPRIRTALQDVGDDLEWQNVTSHVRRRKFIFKNSYDVSLRLLREKALSMIEPQMIARMPRKIWISRDNRSGNINRRTMIGEEQLVRRLEELGFVQMYFEHLSPLEQIATIHAADVIGSFHGAFFGHMAFARPDAHVIEVGSVQTQLHRWGDFLGNAHVAGCRYSKVFADTADDDPATIDPITGGLVGVRVGDAAIDLICRLAAEGQFA